ncbi:MAG: Nif3-like dinuclear metal center hexameric protein [DPANN group archaeon]|nr:Nif3-like dinuclear metal center hexameric protein [DPANN group archaeon]
MEKNKLLMILEKDFPIYKKDIFRQIQPILDKHFETYCTINYKNYFSGLMLDNTDKIEKIFCVVFPSEEIILKLAKQTNKNSLIFSHHPMDWNQFGSGFVPISKRSYELLKTNKISLFVLHDVLDYHPKYAPSIQLLKHLNIKNSKRLYINGEPLGVYFDLNIERLNIFEEELKRKLNLKKLQKVIFNNKIKRICVVAGGGDNIEFISAANDVGCDTYITGIVYFRGNEYAKKNNPPFIAKAKELKINLLGCSHYVTEKFSLLAMTDYFKSLDIKVDFIEDIKSIEFWNKNIEEFI